MLFSLLVCAARAVISPEEAYEIAMLKREEMAGEGDKFEQLWHRVEGMLDYEDMNVAEAAQTWEDMLSQDVVYHWHNNGKCEGLTQVYACFKREKTIKSESDADIRNRNHRVETVQQGSIQSVRMDISIFRRGATKPERVSELFWIHVSPESGLITRINRWTFEE